MEKKPTPRAVALLPVAVFLALYLVLGIILEYVLKIEMGFYQIPIVVAFLVALLVACLQNRRVSFDEKLVLMGQGIGDKNIVTMILIFWWPVSLWGSPGVPAPRPWPIFCCPLPR